MGLGALDEIGPGSMDKYSQIEATSAVRHLTSLSLELVLRMLVNNPMHSSDAI